MYSTYKHKNEVLKQLNKIIQELLLRGESHDNSKLEPLQAEVFAEYTPKLKTVTYGSNEYSKYLKEMQVALDDHYQKEKHHPEHWPNGISDMTLVDLIEMICDWYAATKRHSDGDIYKSIEINQKRFGYSDELKQIFLNTIEEYLDENIKI